MAEAPRVTHVTVEIVPDLQQFNFLTKAEIIQVGIEARWWSLTQRINQLSRIEASAMSQALARAEWLAEGSVPF